MTERELYAMIVASFRRLDEWVFSELEDANRSSSPESSEAFHAFRRSVDALEAGVKECFNRKPNDR